MSWRINKINWETSCRPHLSQQPVCFHLLHQMLIQLIIRSGFHSIKIYSSLDYSQVIIQKQLIACLSLLSPLHFLLLTVLLSRTVATAAANVITTVLQCFIPCTAVHLLIAVAIAPINCEFSFVVRVAVSL